MSALPTLSRNAEHLPDAVYRDLVDMLFSMTIPVAFMGSAFVGVAFIAGEAFHDPWMMAFAIAVTLLTIVRLLTLRAYRRRAGATLALATLARWETRYAWSTYLFAILLGLFNVRALMFHDALLHLIAVSLVFVFGAGLVSRISIRPRICIISMLLATLPTAITLLVHSFMAHSNPIHAELFAIEALLMMAAIVMSLQSIGHLHRSMVEHLTTKHDYGMLAKRDALTGLPNRLLLRERFQKDIARVSRTGSRLAIHYLDLDGFKAVNDLNGHPAGDAILREVATRLESVIRSEDTLCRIGGDEFVVLQAMISHEAEAEMLARRIIKKLSAPYRVGEADARLSVSVGIDIATETGTDLEQLIQRADTALYVAKTSGKGRFHFFRDDLAPAVPASLPKAHIV
ncbi:diguanylate cyclase domain-containing protein [Sphingomonas sp. ASY06-1R]|uniref:diguanylate cyclase domain-containing protein n=1 Tax=Sphingomonas sp. ASY06-1R TaxID=3445771 RepID=UPI003FA1F54E